MKLHLFPKALETAAPSDRDVVPLRVPVATLSVAPSRNRVRTVVRVRCYSQALATVRYDRQGRAGFFNLGGAYGLHSLFSSLRKFLQEPRGVFTVFTSPCPLRVVAHEQQRSERSLSWVTRNMLRVTKCL
jgi:hypothetical protein